MTAAPAATVASPCISICQMHAGTGWCVGCLRSLDEIAAWGGLDDSSKRRVLQGLGPRRLAWRKLQAAAALATPPQAATQNTTGPADSPGGPREAD